MSGISKQKAEMMTHFELFCMIYYALEADWEESHNKEPGYFLSGANPFLFKDEGSADPEVYTEFSTQCPETVYF